MPGKQPTVSTDSVDAALDKVLRAVGSLPIRSYMPSTQQRARAVMRELLAGQGAVEVPHLGEIGKRA